MSAPAAVTRHRSVRLAQLEDLERMSVVAAASFYHSPVFHYERPWYRDYPLDTISDYETSLRLALADPQCIVFVAEDELRLDEDEEVYDSLREVLGSPTRPVSCPSSKVVIGFVTATLAPNSRHLGLCHQEKISTNFGRRSQHRDKSEEAMKLYHSASAEKKRRVFEGKMVLNTIAVHPAYWRRGHAANLASAVIGVAQTDAVQLGVTAAPLGVKLFESVGFKERARIALPRHRDYQKDSAELWLGVYE